MVKSKQEDGVFVLLSLGSPLTSSLAGLTQETQWNRKQNGFLGVKWFDKEISVTRKIMKKNTEHDALWEKPERRTTRSINLINGKQDLPKGYNPIVPTIKSSTRLRLLIQDGLVDSYRQPENIYALTNPMHHSKPQTGKCTTMNKLAINPNNINSCSGVKEKPFKCRQYWQCRQFRMVHNGLP